MTCNFSWSTRARSILYQKIIIKIIFKSDGGLNKKIDPRFCFVLWGLT